MQKLSRKDQILMGVTLFSMFFGAGNLIFPSFIGYEAGSASLPAFIGFVISAVGLPILGVAAVAKSNDLESLAMRVSKPFSAVFTMLIYLSIGPLLAIPRTASTSFEMAVTPFVSGEQTVVLMRIVYSVVFFAIAFALALHPTKLVDFLGKRLAPVLIVLIVILFGGCILHGVDGLNVPASAYAKAPVVRGFLDGYQTMDAMAALIFGIVLTMNIKARGVTAHGAVMHTTFRSGFIAVIPFALIYGALTWIGAAGGYGASAVNGAQVLTHVAKQLFGPVGQIMLAAIFIIACLNTCVSLLCCCGEYFENSSRSCHTKSGFLYSPYFRPS